MSAVEDPELTRRSHMTLTALLELRLSADAVADGVLEETLAVTRAS
jgi:hypothetical protein